MIWRRIDEMKIEIQYTVVYSFEGRSCFFYSCYLISSNEMDGDAHVGEVDQPEGLVEAKPSKEVAGSVVPEGCIAEAAAEDVK